MVDLKIPFYARVQNAWNAFTGRGNTENVWDVNIGPGYSNPMHRSIITTGTEQSVISSIFTRIAMDVSQISLKHTRVERSTLSYLETIQSGLNERLTLSANIDQTARTFIQDLVYSILDNGVAAIVPVDTSSPIDDIPSFDILSWRVGEIVTWFPRDIRVEVYNDRTGFREQIVVPKLRTGIIENPLYSVINEPNSTLKRLIAKLNLLDVVDEAAASGRLDLIIQLPYVVRSSNKKEMAESRIASLESQLHGSKHGIAYTDATEKVVQLNRPAESNLLSQIEYLTRMLYSQLGLSEGIFDGTASEEEYLNYYNRTIEPIVSAIALEIKRKFITKTAIAQGHHISHFRNPFSLVPASQLADLADTFTRNEILTGNEFRSILGYEPSKDPEADVLRNKNLNKQDSGTEPIPTKIEEQ